MMNLLGSEPRFARLIHYSISTRRNICIFLVSLLCIFCPL